MDEYIPFPREALYNSLQVTYEDVFVRLTFKYYLVIRARQPA